MPKRRSELVRIESQLLLDRPTDPVFFRRSNLGKVVSDNIGMIEDLESRLHRQAEYLRAPNIPVTNRLLFGKRLFPLRRSLCPVRILMNDQGLTQKIASHKRHGQAFLLGHFIKRFVDRWFQDNIKPRLLSSHKHLPLSVGSVSQVMNRVKMPYETEDHRLQTTAKSKARMGVFPLGFSAAACCLPSVV